MTSQCEAYEVMKMKDQPRGAGQTTSAPATTGPEQAYEEIGEGLTRRSGHGQEARATPQQEQGIQQTYEEVSHDTVEKNPSSTHQRAELSHYD